VEAVGHTAHCGRVALGAVGHDVTTFLMHIPPTLLGFCKEALHFQRFMARLRGKFLRLKGLAAGY
jgi:hypothetical protein